MSHYTVLVINDDATTAESLLAPFNENLEMDPYVEFTKAEAVEDMREHFAKETERLHDEAELNKTVELRVAETLAVVALAKANGGVIPEGHALPELPYRFTIDYLLEECDPDEIRNALTARRNVHDDWCEDVSWNDEDKVTITDEIANDFEKTVSAYDDDELYAQFIAYHGVEDDRIDEEGNILSTYNPDSKWDWCSEGGRWCGGIPTKDGGRDCCEVADIDWTPNEEEAKAAARFWEVVVEGAELREDEDENDFWSLYKSEYYIDRYGSKEEYIKEAAAFSTYAVLTPDGVWHEAGPMGWFGMCGGSGEDHRAFKAGYEALVRQYEDGCYATLVDCHI